MKIKFEQRERNRTYASRLPFLADLAKFTSLATRKFKLIFQILVYGKQDPRLRLEHFNFPQNGSMTNRNNLNRKRRQLKAPSSKSALKLNCCNIR